MIKAHISNGHIAVEISRASLGNTSSKFSVAESRKDGGYRRNQEGDYDTRPGYGSGNFSRQHIHAGPQCAADPQGHKVEGGKASPKVGLLSLRLQRFPTGQALQKEHDFCTRHPVNQDIWCQRRNNTNTGPKLPLYSPAKKCWVQLNNLNLCMKHTQVKVITFCKHHRVILLFMLYN